MLFSGKTKEKKIKKLRKYRRKFLDLRNKFEHEIQPEVFVRNEEEPSKEKRDFANFNGTLSSIDMTLNSIEDWLEYLENIQD